MPVPSNLWFVFYSYHRQILCDLDLLCPTWRNRLWHVNGQPGSSRETREEPCQGADLETMDQEPK